MMEYTQIADVVAAQHGYFNSRATLDYGFRINALKRLKQAVRSREKQFIAALNQDLGKSEFEAYATEVGFVLHDIGMTVKHLKRWSFFSLLKSDFFDRALPWTRLILRERRFIWDLNLKLSSRISVLLTYGLLFTMLWTAWWKGSPLLSAVLLAALLLINAPLYLFFHRKRGLAFALRVIPLHWLYYFYSGLAFAIGIARNWFL